MSASAETVPKRVERSVNRGRTYIFEEKRKGARTLVRHRQGDILTRSMCHKYQDPLRSFARWNQRRIEREKGDRRRKNTPRERLLFACTTEISDFYLDSRTTWGPVTRGFVTLSTLHQTCHLFPSQNNKQR